MKNGFKDYMEMIEPPKEEVMKQVILQATQILDHKQRHGSYGEFLWTQMLFLKPGLWGRQLLCLCLGFACTYLCYSQQLEVLTRYLLSFIPMLLHMLSVPALMKSVDAQTLELEQVTYHRYRDALMAKLLVIGLTNLCLISVLMLTVYGIAALSLEQLILYTLVPYNITCCISLIIMLWIRNGRSIFDCIITQMICSLFLFLCSNTLYMERAYLVIWKWMLLGSTCLLVVLCLLVLKQSKAYLLPKKRSEYLCD